MKDSVDGWYIQVFLRQHARPPIGELSACLCTDCLCMYVRTYVRTDGYLPIPHLSEIRRFYADHRFPSEDSEVNTPNWAKKKW